MVDLDLDCNGIGDDGLRAIAESLHANTTLTMLGLRGNAFSEEGAKHLAAALRKNATLKSINLSGEKGGGRDDCVGGQDPIATGEHCTAPLLTHLTARTRSFPAPCFRPVAGNSVGPAGTQHIADALMGNATLLAMDIECEKKNMTPPFPSPDAFVDATFTVAPLTPLSPSLSSLSCSQRHWRRWGDGVGGRTAREQNAYEIGRRMCAFISS